MIQYVVIADDLTGANATGAMLKKLNLRTITIMNDDPIHSDSLSEYDVITYPTDSRAVDKKIAYLRVNQAAEKFKSPEVKLYNKRIDSTLRGNIGAEIDAMLDALGEDRIAIVVPSFPQAGRTAVGGYLLVNQIMLQRTDAAKDPRNPISTSIIETLVAEQTKNKVKSIYLNSVYQGVQALAMEIEAAVKEGNRILVFDALQVEDLDTIAEAVITSGISFITVDPGPFNAAVAAKLTASEHQRKSAKILMSIGSVSSLTKLQIEEVQRTSPIALVEIQAEKLIESEQQREKEIQRVTAEILENEARHDLFCVLINSVHPEKRLDFHLLSKAKNTTEEELSRIINDSIAEISHRIFQASPHFKGLFSSGGDITVAISRRFRASGMALMQEVFPLVAFGILEGGDFPGLKIITKGGMVGDKEGMQKCIRFLKEQLPE